MPPPVLQIRNRALLACIIAGTAACAGNIGALALDSGVSRDASVGDAPAIDAGSIDAGGVDSGLLDAGSSDAGRGDAGVSSSCLAPAGLGRAARWSRTHPMFIAGMIDGLGPPSVAEANEYFDLFQANAIHVTGFPGADWLMAPIMARGANVAYFGWLWKPEDLSEIVQPGRIGFQIGDEPSTLDALKAFEVTAQMARVKDPNALFAINLANVPAEVLDYAQSATTFDIISTDNYTFLGSEAYPLLGRIRKAALASGKSYWRYLNSYAERAGGGTESDFRWDAYLGAVFGYTGHTWFVYQNAGPPGSCCVNPVVFAEKGGYAKPKTAQYAWLGKINHELANVGRSLTMLHSTDVSYVAASPAALPAGIDAWRSGAGGDGFLSQVRLPAAAPADHEALVGHFADDCGDIYVFVQNAAHHGPEEISTFRLELDFTNATDSTLDKTQVLALDATSGQVVSLPLVATGPTTAVLELRLLAGSAVLFKYKTARPFAMQ